MTLKKKKETNVKIYLGFIIQNVNHLVRSLCRSIAIIKPIYGVVSLTLKTISGVVLTFGISCKSLKFLLS